MCVKNDTKDITAESKGWYFEQATVTNTIELVKELMATYGIDINHVIPRIS